MSKLEAAAAAWRKAEAAIVRAEAWVAKEEDSRGWERELVKLSRETNLAENAAFEATAALAESEGRDEAAAAGRGMMDFGMGVLAPPSELERCGVATRVFYEALDVVPEGSPADAVWTSGDVYYAAFVTAAGRAVAVAGALNEIIEQGQAPGLLES